MFLGKNTGTRKLRFVKAHDLKKWKNTKKADEGKISLNDVTEKEWNFTIGQKSEIFERLKQMPVTLGTIADIFVGTQTSADDIFVLALLPFYDGWYPRACSILSWK